MGDFAESKLFQLIEKADVRAIQFYLSSVHRKRGYGLQPGEALQVGDTNLTIQNVKIISVPSGQFLPPLSEQLGRDAPFTIDHEDTRTAADL